jgi:predicted nucleic acid-binding protein
LKAAQIFNFRTRAAVDKQQLMVLEIGQIERDKTWEYLEKFSDHKLSFTDATIVVNFKEYNLDQIFTFDKHFRDINLPTNLS